MAQDTPRHRTPRNDGKAFETAVATALRAAGKRVTPEVLLQHKKVDLLACQLRWGKEWTTAIECKDEASPLAKDAVVKIWSDYEPLYSSRLVDEVLIVSRRGFSPAALAFVSGVRALVARTIDDLIDSIIDFRPYLDALIARFAQSPDGISHYYQPALTLGGDDLETIVRFWIRGTAAEGCPPPDRPVAILGAYGQGKSSFALHLAAKLAQEHIADPSTRMPILIRLGDIAGEQSLEGLLGKHFTHHFGLDGYTFAAFKLLNDRGRFVIVLDGFDEMKQLITWREFRYNLRELNRLHGDASRLLLLGRPTAFETDEQHAYALHGVRTIPGARTVSEPNWPDFYEIELALLDSARVRNFLRSYLHYRNSPIVASEADFANLWEQVRSRHLRDLSRRPVQLRMLAEILPDYRGDIADLTVKRLYELFIVHLIDEVVRREEDKNARLAFSTQERREFLRVLAYWLWMSPELVAAGAQVPDDVVRAFAKGNTDLEGVRRDLLAGAPIDRRAGERLRFPHRSFQEYLVAEELWLRLKNEKLSLFEVDRLLNDEIAQFLGLQAGRDEFAAILRSLPSLRGNLSSRLVQNVFESSEMTNIFTEYRETGMVRERVAPRPWVLLAAALQISRRGGRPKEREALAEMVGRSLRSSDDDERLRTLALFIYMFAGGSDDHVFSAESILDALTLLIERIGRVERITSRELESRSSLSPLADGVVFDRHRDGGSFGIIRDSARLERAKGKRSSPLYIRGDELVVRWVSRLAAQVGARLVVSNSDDVDLRGLRPIFASYLNGYAFVSEWLDESPSGRLVLSNRVPLLESMRFPGALDSLRKTCRLLNDGWARAVAATWVSPILEAR